MADIRIGPRQLRAETLATRAPTRAGDTSVYNDTIRLTTVAPPQSRKAFIILHLCSTVTLGRATQPNPPIQIRLALFEKLISC